MIRALCLAAMSWGFATGAQAMCGPVEQACTLADGEYHLALPEPRATAVPVVVFLHGAGGSGANVMRNAGLVSQFLSRGYAVLAPTGSRRFGAGTGHLWNFLPGWDGRDETDFLKRAVADASERFDLNSTRVLLSGFSAGGFMVNYLACTAPSAFAAYAPISGGFWRPYPQGCAGPVKLFHTHGWRDTTVPIEGRFLRNGRFQQGDIFAGLEIWRAANQCTGENPSSYSETGGFWRREWANCASNSSLEFALFSGGHTIPQGWAGMILDWFEAVAAR